MEDVVDIRIDYEPTTSPVEDDSKSPSHEGEEKKDSEPIRQTANGTHELADNAAECGLASAMWVECLLNEDSGNNSAPVSDESASENVVDTRRSICGVFRRV